MGSKNGNNGGGGDVDAATDPYGKETMSKGYQDRESVRDRDTSLDTQNKKGTQYSPELAAAITKANEEAFQDRMDRQLGISLNEMQANALSNTPGLNMGQFSPSELGELNPTAGLTFGQSLGYTGAQLGQSLGDFGSAISNMSPSSIGLGIMGALAGIPGMGLITGLFGEEDQGEDPGNLGLQFSSAPNNLVNNLNFTPIGTDVSPNPSMEPDKGGNKPDPILPILEGAPPTSEELIGQNPIVPMSEGDRLAMLYRLPMGGISNLIS